MYNDVFYLYSRYKSMWKLFSLALSIVLITAHLWKEGGGDDGIKFQFYCIETNLIK